MGEVWIGLHDGRTRVAIKRLLADAVRDREIVTRFRREALLLGKIRSDHVSKVIEQIDDPEYGSLLIMEYVEGEALESLLAKKAPLDVEEVISLGVDVCRAIADLHRSSIVHRDLKPENVILRRLPNGERRAVLIDFGLARLLDAKEGKAEGEETLTGITRADTGVGTIAYMAPEQILSSRDVSRSADVYALGAILYRAATGKNVFGDVDDMTYARTKLHEDAPPLTLPRRDPLSLALVEIVGKALKRRHKERYEGIEPMLADLLKASEKARAEIDAPTQHAPISSLLGLEAGRVSFGPRPDAPPEQRIAPGGTFIPGVSAGEVPAPVSVRVAQPQPQPQSPQRSPAPQTMLMSGSPNTNPSPPARLGSLPPVAPPLGRPPQSSYSDVATGPTVRLPDSTTPPLAAPSAPGFSKQVVLFGFTIMLVVGILVGFFAHATLVDTPVCPPAGAAVLPGRSP